MQAHEVFDKLGIEDKTTFYVDRLAQIDRILKRPVRAFIALASYQAKTSSLLDIAPLLADGPDPDPRKSPHTFALYFATLQRLSKVQRRIPWLANDSDLRTLTNLLIQPYLDASEARVPTIFPALQSTVLGDLNPLTAAYLFRALLEAGEHLAHSALGFLSVFSILWPLYRKWPDSLSAGARIEPCAPSAYITANCLLPIRKVQRITRLRADLFEQILVHLGRLRDCLSRADHRAKFSFNVDLDEFCATALRLSKLTLATHHFQDMSAQLSSRSQSLVVGDPVGRYEDTYKFMLGLLTTALSAFGTQSTNAVAAITHLLDDLTSGLAAFLDRRAALHLSELQRKPISELLGSTCGLNLNFARDHVRDKAYWQDLHDAAAEAIAFCRTLVGFLDAAAQSCKNLDPKKPDARSIEIAICQLIKANTDVIDSIRTNDRIRSAAQWCRSIMDREIAYSSAGNLTEFDPAELVSAIAVTARWNLLSTPRQVADAVAKALRGAQEDGSWRLGFPFFTPDDAAGVWSGTADIVWLLTSAIKQYPNDITSADTTLFSFVDWLDRTQKAVTWRGADMVGWPSDRMRYGRKIHILTTAFSINALLEVRDMVEYRLWQLCERRFAVPPIAKPLKGLAPVDLGLGHHSRLHGLLADMVLKVQGDQYQNGNYSLILHGPPGSSKTSIAEALSAVMWRESGGWGTEGGRKPRFIRITPADFTRMGESRLDSEARLIFHMLCHIRGAVIFFDEIDDLLRRRPTSPKQTTFLDLIVPAMLNRLADLRDACPHQELCFVLATNFIEKVDPALIRPGRIDRALPVVYPDEASRVAIAQSHLDKLKRLVKDPAVLAAFERVVDQVVGQTVGWPWKAIEECCKGLAQQIVAGSDETTSLREKIAENRRRFSPPLYLRRMEKRGGTKCPELVYELDRYLHEAIEGSAKGAFEEGLVEWYKEEFKKQSE